MNLLSIILVMSYKAPLSPYKVRLASVGKEREPRVGKLGWYWNFDTGFERNFIISFKIATVY